MQADVKAIGMLYLTFLFIIIITGIMNTVEDILNRCLEMYITSLK